MTFWGSIRTEHFLIICVGICSSRSVLHAVSQGNFYLSMLKIDPQIISTFRYTIKYIHPSLIKSSKIPDPSNLKLRLLNWSHQIATRFETGWRLLRWKDFTFVHLISSLLFWAAVYPVPRSTSRYFTFHSVFCFSVSFFFQVRRHDGTMYRRNQNTVRKTFWMNPDRYIVNVSAVTLSPARSFCPYPTRQSHYSSTSPTWRH
jgi:hypothetical protein